MNLSEKIRSTRIELNLTQQQLADKVFVTRQTISKWELGKSEPDAVSLALLEKVLFAQLIGNANSGSEKGDVLSMKTVINVVSFLCFGVLFFPLRFIAVKIKYYWRKPLWRFLILPAAAVLYILYIHSLKTTAMYFVIGISFVFYLTAAYYFYSSKEE